MYSLPGQGSLSPQQAQVPRSLARLTKLRKPAERTKLRKTTKQAEVRKPKLREEN